jgi:hypothetical protein
MDEAVYRGVTFRRPDVLRAMAAFDRDVRATFPDRRWVRYGISHGGLLYPPKELLRLAINAEPPQFVLGGGPNVNRCFERLGFDVVELATPA